jgi:GTP-binding protein HflX
MADLADDGRMLEFWNKRDLLDPEEAERIGAAADRDPDVVFGSAVTDQGLDDAFADIDRRLAASSTIVELTLDSADGKGLAWLYRHGRVLERQDADGSTRITAAFEPAERALLERRLSPKSLIERPEKLFPDQR